LRGSELQRAMDFRIDEVRPDIVACTGWADPEYHAALRKCNAIEIPAIVMSDSTFEDEQRRWWKEQLKRPVIKGFSAAVVAGTRSRSYLSGLGFDPRAIFEPCDVVDNGHFAVPREGTRARSGAQRGPYFLCVSRYLAKKNLFRLVEAFAAYRTLHGSGSWDLVILGSGELADKLSAAIGAAGVASHVVRPGFVQYDELPAYYSGAGAFILPSLSDQWGLSVNEAMASGVPVLVSTACGCAPDLVVDGENGFAFDPLDVAAMAESMRRVAMLPERGRIEMGLAGRSRVARYTPQRFAEALLAAAHYAREHRKPAGFATLLALRASAMRG